MRYHHHHSDIQLLLCVRCFLTFGEIPSALPLVRWNNVLSFIIQLFSELLQVSLRFKCELFIVDTMLF